MNQRSGVSVRLSVSNLEAVSANALRRSLRAAERVVVTRVDDLDAMAASASGKIEIETLDDGARARSSTTSSGRRAVGVQGARPPSNPSREAFEDGAVADIGEDVRRAARGARRGDPGTAPARRSADAVTNPRPRWLPQWRRARGHAPVEAPQQGHIGHQRHLSQPQLTATRVSRDARGVAARRRGRRARRPRSPAAPRRTARARRSAPSARRPRPRASRRPRHVFSPRASGPASTISARRESIVGHDAGHAVVGIDEIDRIHDFPGRPVGLLERATAAGPGGLGLEGAGAAHNVRTWWRTVAGS